MSDLVIQAAGLVKTFGTTRALDGLDLELAGGEVLGFLGPNGAGKSTTIRALLGQIRLNGGTARIFGADVWRDAVAVHRRLAYVPGDVALWPGLTGGESIDLLSSLQGRPNAARRDDLLARFDLDPTKRTRSYSKGNRQKVGLVAALSTDADLLLLDEPTSGLDPLMEAVFQEVVRERVLDGVSVLLSSHIMGEVEALCDRVSIIRAGAVVRTGTIDELRSETASTLTVTTSGPLAGLDTMPGVTVRSHRSDGDGTHVVARVTAQALVQAVGVVVAARPRTLTVEPPSLDELFLEHYRTTVPAAGERAGTS